MKRTLLQRLPPGLRRRCLRLTETILWGGKWRERILLKLLQAHYESAFRRDWVWSSDSPHFFNQRLNFFQFAFAERPSSPHTLFRGFYCAEVIRNGDRLLDIGCGDGFFTKRFMSSRCGHVDAIDVEPSAIRAAIAENRALNIRYHRLDAMNDPFPGDRYDVVVWDGGLGHVSADATMRILGKILKVLKPEGIFAGSESMGVEGSDHCQFFRSLDDLHNLFSSCFRYIELRSHTYESAFTPGLIRVEAYWRCSNDPARLSQIGWRDYSNIAESPGLPHPAKGKDH